MDAWLGIALGSGVVVALLGAFLLAADPRRDWNRVFSLFAMFWGLQIVAANGVRLIDAPRIAHGAATLSLALLIPLYFFLIVFAAIFPRPRRPFGTSWPALLALLLPAALALVVLLLSPRSLLAGVAPVAGGGSTMEWGPLFPVLVLGPLYAGFFYALFVMMQRLHEAERVIERRQVLFVLAALVLFVAYNAPLQLILFGTGGRREAAALTAFLIAAIMLAGVVLLAVLALRLASATRRSATLASAREHRAVLVAMGVAALAGVLEGTVTVIGWERPQMVGLVRVGSVGLIAYGIARYQLFDLDLRVKHAARILTTLTVVAVIGVGIWALLNAIGFPRTTRTIIVSAFVLVTLVPAAFLVRRAVDRILPHVDHRNDHVYLRKLQVYQAAIENAAPTPELERLRAQLGLGASDHDIATRLVQQSHAPTQLAPGTLAFDRYLVDARLGEGTFGRVFLARDTRLGRKVVIKELEARWRGHPAVAARFLREAKIMGRLRHPRIVALHEVERRGEDQFLVLEHVEGGTLAERLAHGRLPVPEALRIVHDVVDGLEAAHRRGIVHRDLKPANILLDLDGRAKLADFGVASLGDAALEETLAGLPAPVERHPVGSLLYMAPEQARGESADARSDLYAVAAMLYHLVVGAPHRRLARLDVNAARERVAADVVPSLDDVPAELRTAVERGLEPDPARRMADAAAMRALLPAPTLDRKRRMRPAAESLAA